MLYGDLKHALFVILDQSERAFYLPYNIIEIIMIKLIIMIIPITIMIIHYTIMIIPITMIILHNNDNPITRAIIWQ